MVGESHIVMEEEVEGNSEEETFIQAKTCRIKGAVLLRAREIL